MIYTKKEKDWSYLTPLNRSGFGKAMALSVEELIKGIQQEAKLAVARIMERI